MIAADARACAWSMRWRDTRSGSTLTSSLSSSSSGAAITATPGVTFGWVVEDLAPGQGGVITITGRAPATDCAKVVNTAIIAAAGPDEVEANDRAATESGVNVPLYVEAIDPGASLAVNGASAPAGSTFCFEPGATITLTTDEGQAATQEARPTWVTLGTPMAGTFAPEDSPLEALVEGNEGDLTWSDLYRFEVRSGQAITLAMTTHFTNCPVSNHMILDRGAPNTLRTPISLVRCSAT